MSEKSAIEWTDSSWNPTRGCTKIAQGCKHCYAETFAERFRGVPGHPYELGFDPRTAPDKLLEPLRWKKPRRIFVDSMSDLFHEAFDFEYIAACFGVMAACADRDMGHVFQVLTKRPDRAAQFFQWLTGTGGVESITKYCRLRIQTKLHETVKEWVGYDNPLRPAVNVTRGWPLPNVWIGTSIATQKDADENIPHLLQIPAAVRFLSIEPLIEAVSLRWLAAWPENAPTTARNPYNNGRTNEYDGLRRPDWVIVGGESGPGARPCNVEWIRSIVAQCKAAGVPCFVKQLGAKPVLAHDPDFCGCLGDPGCAYRSDGPQPLNLRDRKGGDIEEFPIDLRVREFPYA